MEVRLLLWLPDFVLEVLARTRADRFEYRRRYAGLWGLSPVLVASTSRA